MNFNNRFVCCVFGLLIFINELDLIIHETPWFFSPGVAEQISSHSPRGLRSRWWSIDKLHFPIAEKQGIEIVLRRSINNLQSVTKLIHQISHLFCSSVLREPNENSQKKHNIPDICRLTPLQIQTNYVSFRLVAIAPSTHVIIIVTFLCLFLEASPL